TLLYQRRHGPNPAVADRAAGESDLYALRIIDLFLPARAHRLAPLADLRARLDSFPVSPVWPAPQTPLGVAGAGGLALSLAAVAAVAGAGGGARGRAKGRIAAGPTRLALAQLGVLNLAAIVVAASTGFSSLLALAGFTQVRVWSRMAVFIAFFSFAALGQFLQAVGPRIWASARARTRRLGPAGARLLGATVALSAFALAVLDQTQPATRPPYAANQVVFTDDRAFVGQIERLMAPGAAVFQLPVVSFPEGSPPAGMLDYALLRGYLHSSRLRWSYASMRGRPADWAWSLEGRSVEAVVDRVTAAGFSGLYVDQAGFEDGAAALALELERLVGAPAVTSRQGLMFWDLRVRAGAQLYRLGRPAVEQLRREVLSPAGNG
ncbi:MAG: hypothetical protein ABIW46_01475, partial [Acidimicrobiales bacterium]